MNSPKKLNQMKRSAILYLMANKSEIPNGMGKALNKLSGYEREINDVITKGAEAEKLMNDMIQEKIRISGCISSIVDLVIDDIPDDKAVEWGEKGEEIFLQRQRSQQSMSQQSPQQQPQHQPTPNPEDDSIDIAGSTSNKAAEIIGEKED